MSGYILHATDRPVDVRRKTVTTVCGLRVSTYRVFASGDIVNCVGCRAILAERAKERESARVNDPDRADYRS